MSRDYIELCMRCQQESCNCIAPKYHKIYISSLTELYILLNNKLDMLEKLIKEQSHD